NARTPNKILRGEAADTLANRYIFNRLEVNYTQLYAALDLHSTQPCGNIRFNRHEKREST
ncbi:MAG: hypothetical protein ACOYOO_14095, partial [Saprospiraceae bacterium]